MIRITGDTLEVAGLWGANSGSGGGTGPHIVVRIASWLAGVKPPSGPSDPLGPGGRWAAFKAWVKKLLGRK